MANPFNQTPKEKARLKDAVARALTPRPDPFAALAAAQREAAKPPKLPAAHKLCPECKEACLVAYKHCPTCNNPFYTHRKIRGAIRFKKPKEDDASA